MIGDAYCKGRSLALFTMYQQFTVLHFDHVLTDGQAKTGTAVFAGNGRVGLFKGLKNGSQLLLSDTNSCILDGDLYHHLLLVVLLDRGRDGDMPLIGEFQGVA